MGDVGCRSARSQLPEAPPDGRVAGVYGRYGCPAKGLMGKLRNASIHRGKGEESELAADTRVARTESGKGKAALKASGTDNAVHQGICISPEKRRASVRTSS